MRNQIMASASMVLLIGIGACATQQPEPEPVVVEEPPAPPVVEPEPVIIEEEPIEEVVVPPPPPPGPLAGSLEDFQVNVGERVYFDLDEYRLDRGAQETLKRQAAWLTAHPGITILVAGNCDERGTREYNLALGERRANVVKDYLVDLGIDPARIETVSYGKERPLVPGSNEEAWAQNRNGFTQLVSGVAQ